MPMAFLLKINWVDILIVLVLLRVFYISSELGFQKEAFKLAGVILATYLSLHYFTYCSDLLKARFSLKAIPLDFLDFLSFLFLAVLGYYILMLLRSVFERFIKVEAVPNLSRWGGLILGIARGFLLASLIVFSLTISSISYLKKSVAISLTGKEIFRVAPQTYRWIWKNISSRFMATEKINETVTEVEADLNK